MDGMKLKSILLESLPCCFPRSAQFAAALLLCVFLPTPLPAKGHPGPSSILDGNYNSALAVADHFLQAWQTENQEDGLLLLSDSAKQHISEERLDAFFAHGASVAYEIQRGRILKDGRYTFPVVLFGVASSSHPHFAQIVVAKTGKHEWAVDRLP
jgi:hypothetical protein